MPASTPVRRALLKPSLVLTGLLATGLVATAYYFSSDVDQPGEIAAELTYTAIRAPFVASIAEPGTIESSSNVEIRCRVRERGGTAILEMVEEGTVVSEGDFIAQLDDSAFRDELVEQRIRVASDKAAVIQAESNLNTARQTLKEFENGQYRQELNTLNAELALAEESLRRAREYQRFSENLARKGYITKTQLEADKFAVVKAEQERDLAKNKLVVYEEYSQARMKAELEAEILQQEAQLEAANHTLELSEQRLTFYEQQVANCRIVAPSSGQVVYFKDLDGRGESGIVIEEGATAREGQVLVLLPDPDNMQMVVNVNDSKISGVRDGQEALIRLNTNQDVPIRGKVRKVADFPLPQRWSQAPIEYQVFVDITEENEIVRSGLRGTAEIFVERVDDAIQVPVSSIVRRNEAWFVVVVGDGTRELRQVELGPNNESHVVVLSGVDEGEEVLVDPQDLDEESEETDTEGNDKGTSTTSP